MNVVADTATGKVEGLAKGNVVQFRGVPYARAARFRPPEPAEPWEGVREAKQFGPRAPQNPSPLEAMLGGPQNGLMSEDCLVLNIYTPAPDDAGRPVMVWVHGGGFAAGAGDIPWYDGSNLVRQGDVVVVTLNYRLGALGFLHLSHLLGFEVTGSGINGLRDQIAALRWVRDNIAGFGGDPDSVTLFGESAGAMSIGTLLGAPDTSGLFHRAIAQSGAASQLHPPDQAELVTERCLAELDMSPGDAERLLDMPAGDILRAQKAVETEVLSGRGPGPLGAGGQLPFRPVLDGTLLPRQPLHTIAAGGSTGIPLLVGTNLDEWNLFHLPVRRTGPTDDDKLRRRLTKLVGQDRVGDVLDAYRRARPDADPDDLLCAVMTDKVFRMPAVRLADAQQPHAPRVSLYRFGYRTGQFDGLLGACHGIEIPFVFGNLDRTGVSVLLGEVDDDARALSERCTRAWLQMARTGSPEHDDLPWPAYDPRQRATVELGGSIGGVSHDPDGELRRLWDDIDGVMLGPAPRPAALPPVLQ